MVARQQQQQPTTVIIDDDQKNNGHGGRQNVRILVFSFSIPTPSSRARMRVVQWSNYAVIPINIPFLSPPFFFFFFFFWGNWKKNFGHRLSCSPTERKFEIDDLNRKEENKFSIRIFFFLNLSLPLWKKK